MPDTTIAIIPARGGSKRLPRKNLAMLGGLPLVAWPILVARESRFVDRVVLSTEDDEIAHIGAEHGAEVLRRPHALSGDEVGNFEVIVHLGGELGREGRRTIFVVLEPSSPFRSPELVDRCIAPVLEGRADSCATFRASRTHPYRTWRIENSAPKPFHDPELVWRPRQQLPQAFELSGEVYAFDFSLIDMERRAFLFGRTEAQIVDGGVDIDEPDDLERARQHFANSDLARLRSRL